MAKISLDQSLEEINIPKDIVHILNLANIFTVGELTNLKTKELKQIPNLTSPQVKFLKSFLAINGLVFKDNPIYNYQLQEYVFEKLEVDDLDLTKLSDETRWRLLNLKIWVLVSIVPDFIRKIFLKLKQNLTLKEVLNQGLSDDSLLVEFLHSLGYKFANEEGFKELMIRLYKSYLNDDSNYYDFSKIVLPPEKDKNTILNKYFALTKKIGYLQKRKKMLRQSISYKNAEIEMLEKQIESLILEMETLQMGYDLR